MIILWKDKKQTETRMTGFGVQFLVFSEIENFRIEDQQSHLPSSYEISSKYNNSLAVITGLSTWVHYVNLSMSMQLQ
jgi:hypothetical protein